MSCQTYSNTHLEVKNCEERFNVSHLWGSGFILKFIYRHPSSSFSSISLFLICWTLAYWDWWTTADSEASLWLAEAALADLLKRMSWRNVEEIKQRSQRRWTFLFVTSHWNQMRKQTHYKSGVYLLALYLIMSVNFTSTISPLHPEETDKSMLLVWEDVNDKLKN